ncbi:MAG: hypothetical protein WCJ30_00415 [Deltaproteobacteria bacterium]
MIRRSAWFLFTFTLAHSAAAQSAPTTTVTPSSSPAPGASTPVAADASSAPPAASVASPLPSSSPAPPSSPAPDDLRVSTSGRVPLVIESPRGRQTLGVTVERPWMRVDRDDVCSTPCTLFVPPGAMVLSSAGRGIAPEDTDLTVPRDGLLVRLRAPSDSARTGGRVLTVVGFFTGLVGAALLISAASDASSGHPGSGMTALAIGGGSAMGAGAAFMIPGLFMLAGSHGGIEFQGPPPSTAP